MACQGESAVDTGGEPPTGPALSHEAPDLDLSEAARDLSAEINRAYWDLHYALQDLVVQQQLATGARRLLETVRTREAMGAGPRSDILQAEVGVARRDEAVIISEGTVRQAEDRLKSLTGLDRNPENWDQRILPTSTPPMRRICRPIWPLALLPVRPMIRSCADRPCNWIDSTWSWPRHVTPRGPRSTCVPGWV